MPPEEAIAAWFSLPQRSGRSEISGRAFRRRSRTSIAPVLQAAAEGRSCSRLRTRTSPCGSTSESAAEVQHRIRQGPAGNRRALRERKGRRRTGNAERPMGSDHHRRSGQRRLGRAVERDPVPVGSPLAGTAKHPSAGRHAFEPLGPVARVRRSAAREPAPRTASHAAILPRLGHGPHAIQCPGRARSAAAGLRSSANSASRCCCGAAWPCLAA